MIGQLNDVVKKRIIKFAIVTGILLLGVLFGLVHPDGGYITLSVILTLPVLFGLWSIYMEFRGLRKPTVIATPHGLEVTSRQRLETSGALREPWANIVALEMRMHTLVRTRYGNEVGRGYRPMLVVYLAGRQDRPVRQFYPSNYHPTWQELFTFVQSVAPHVRLSDHQQADLAAQQQR